MQTKTVFKEAMKPTRRKQEVSRMIRRLTAAESIQMMSQRYPKKAALIADIVKRDPDFDVYDGLKHWRQAELEAVLREEDVADELPDLFNLSAPQDVNGTITVADAADLQRMTYTVESLAVLPDEAFTSAVITTAAMSREDMLNLIRCLKPGAPVSLKTVTNAADAPQGDGGSESGNH